MTALLEVIRRLTPEELDEALALAEDQFFPDARPAQIPPAGDWVVWLILAGRGFGKTRTGAEWLVDTALAHRGSYAIAAPTYADARDVCVEGESGILSVLARRRREPDLWNRSLGEVRLPNGSRLKLLSADEPDRARGWNFSGAWCDELAAWRYPDAWTQLQLATRLGPNPRTVVTTTPRPVQLVRELVARNDGSVVVGRGSTFDNEANLAPAALAELRARYDGTRLGRQELHAELLTDTPGALWTPAMIDAGRVSEVSAAPDLARVVVAVDPAVTSGDESDETGIVAAGVDHAGDVWILADRSCRLSPDGWARRAVTLLDEVEADRIVAEVNNGGDLVELTLRTVAREVPYRKVTATRGKRLRAEPVAALYEQGRVHHVGTFPVLEDQLCSWTPESGTSPDRLDALVWAVTELVLDRPRRRSIVVPEGEAA